MDIFQSALGEVLQAGNLLILALSVLIGLITGAIPGLTVNMAVALAVPITLTMPPVGAIMMLLGLYCSGVYGGSVSAILLNAPERRPLRPPASTGILWPGPERPDWH